MSAIFGLFRFDGQPVEAETLNRMKTAMEFWGPDGSGTWNEGPVGLGHLLLYNTPESLDENLPLQSQNNNFILTAGARIDNRQELLHALGVPASRHAVTSDGFLILSAYERWGGDCLEHLLGDWAFAVWDKHKGELFIARDHHGITGLFYFHNERFLAFASSLKGLFALPEVPRQPNPMRIAQRLVIWPEGEKTFYEGILRLPPAHSLKADSESVSVRRYWHLEHTPDVRFKTDLDYVDAFLEVYGEAVRCRLRSYHPVGVTLSGGLDSGSVAALAARELRHERHHLAAFTSVPLYDTRGLNIPHRFGDEGPFASTTAQFAGNIDIHTIQAEDITPLAGAELFLKLSEEPAYAASNLHWLLSLLDTAQQQGLGVLLTGQGGNATISWFGDEHTLIRGLLRHRQWKLFWEEFNTRHMETSLWRAISIHMLRLLLPAGYFFRYKRFRSHLRLGKEPWRDYSPINPDFARALNLQQQMDMNGFDPTFSGFADSRFSRHAIIGPGRSIVGSTWQQLGSGYGIDVRDPTLDKRVIEFCLGLPEEQYLRAGTDRYLIRRAMDGLLPAEVLWNKRRGLQSADIVQRVINSRDEIQGTLERLAGSHLAQEYLDLPRMNSVFHRAVNQKNIADRRQVDTILLRGLMMGMFLERFEM